MTSLRLRRRMLLAGLVAGLAMPRAACAGASARRIVSIGPAVSETVVALGAVDRLVGVDTASQYPALLQRLPQVGYLRAISAEGS